MKKILSVAIVVLFTLSFAGQARAATAQINSIWPSSVYFWTSLFGHQANPTMYIYGSGFESNAKIYIDGQPATLSATPHISSGFISFTVPTQLTNGTHTVQVKNPDAVFVGTGGISNSKTFTVSGSSYTGSGSATEDEEEEATEEEEDTNDNTGEEEEAIEEEEGADENTDDTSSSDALSPSVNSLSPSSGPIGTRVILNGSNFTSDTRVSFVSQSTKFEHDYSPSEVTVISASQIAFRIPTQMRVEGEVGTKLVDITPGQYYFVASNTIGKSSIKYFTVTLGNNCFFGICPDGTDSASGDANNNDNGEENLQTIIAALQAQITALLNQVLALLAAQTNP